MGYTIRIFKPRVDDSFEGNGFQSYGYKKDQIPISPYCIKNLMKFLKKKNCIQKDKKFQLYKLMEFHVTIHFSNYDLGFKGETGAENCLKIIDAFKRYNNGIHPKDRDEVDKVISLLDDTCFIAY